jgi:hypothetical protein
MTTAIRMIASNDPLPWSDANPKSLSMKSMRQPDFNAFAVAGHNNYGFGTSLMLGLGPTASA